MSDKTDLIYDLLKLDREEAAEFRKEVRKAHQETQEKLQEIESETSGRLSNIETLDEIQNRQLEEHIRRTNILEDLHRDNSDRINKLEEPRKALKTVSKWVGGFGAVAGAIYTVLRLFGLF